MLSHHLTLTGLDCYHFKAGRDMGRTIPWKVDVNSCGVKDLERSSEVLQLVNGELIGRSKENKFPDFALLHPFELLLRFHRS